MSLMLWLFPQCVQKRTNVTKEYVYYHLQPSSLHQFIPLVHQQLILRVYSNEDGICNRSWGNIRSTSIMHIVSMQH